MKKSNIYRFTAILAVLLTIMVACTEDIADVRLDSKLTTSEVLDVTSDMATVLGFVVAEGDGFSEKGVCYATTTDPITDDNKVIYDSTETTAVYTVHLTGLDYATTYYARAYGITGSGTLYGKELSFTTLAEVPIVTTAEVTDISYTSATGGGEVVDAKGSDVTARGVCWSLTSMPTVTDGHSTDGDGLGAFTSSLTGMTEGTTYYVRAYATNNAGTGYGEQDTIITLVPQTRVWNIPGNYVLASYPGSTLGDWSPDASPQVKSIEAAPDNLEGYVNMANGANEWKFATKPNWDGPNYTGDASGNLTESGPNISSPDGYYKINVDANAMTYTALATDWGVIGDATPGGWGADTDLNYDAELQQWIGAMTLIADKHLKFRANDSWDSPNPNYGSANADGNIDTENDNNIPVTIAGDYAVTLDLSSPLAYTYSLNTWGIIGEASPGGWSTDTNLTWDAGNGVFTASLDMTAAEWKFRANDDWGVNFGGSLGALEQDGGNFSISTAGNYTITLNPWTKVATVTMN